MAQHAQIYVQFVLQANVMNVTAIDWDGDGDVDMSDFGILQRNYTGSR